MEIQKTNQVYYFGIIGKNEKLFKRVYVDNAWRNFRRLTLGGWEYLEELPEIVVEYQKGLVPEKIRW